MSCPNGLVVPGIRHERGFVRLPKADCLRAVAGWRLSNDRLDAGRLEQGQDG